ADRRLRRARHDAPDGVADDDAALRRIPALNVIILGPQGSGKGTQAKKIASTYGVPHIATGDMIREMKDRPTELGRELREIYDRGDLVDDEKMIRLIRDRLDRGHNPRVFCLSGLYRQLCHTCGRDGV